MVCNVLVTRSGYFSISQVVSLFELEYNLVVVCLEEGCDRVLPYYLSHGVYQKENAFIEGAVLVAPRGDNLAKYIDPGM